MESRRLPPFREQIVQWDYTLHSPNSDLGPTVRSAGTWYGGGPGEVTCLSCRRGAGLNDWRWSPPWGFGCLGFEFWGWPAFTPPFLSAFGVLLGHRTVYPYGKL